MVGWELLVIAFLIVLNGFFAMSELAIVSARRARLQMASLDHAMWFHALPLTQWRVDDWLLYSLDAPSACAARGYNRGMIFTADGTLVASTMQEGLMRQR